MGNQHTYEDSSYLGPRKKAKRLHRAEVSGRAFVIINFVTSIPHPRNLFWVLVGKRGQVTTLGNSSDFDPHLLQEVECSARGSLLEGELFPTSEESRSPRILCPFLGNKDETKI